MPNEDERCDEEVKTNILTKEFDAKRYSLFHRIEKQCTLDSNFDSFGRDLTKLQRFSKDIIDEADALLSGKKTSENDADKEVDRDLNVVYSRRNILSTAIIKCPTCEQCIIKSAWGDHNLICSIRVKRSQKTDECEISNSADMRVDEFKTCVRPKPPRNLKVVRTDFASLTVQWEASIFDGGKQITDFEIVFYDEPLQGNIRKLKKHSVLLSRWCFTQPIPENYFIIDNLIAGSTYCDMMLRCKNEVGWSEFCHKIDRVQMGAPVPPSRPQRFVVNDITSKSIHFRWTAPFHCGGGTLHSYCLSYLEPIFADDQTAGEPKEIRFESRSVTIPCNQVTFDLYDLRGDTTYLDFQLVAINNYSLKSDITKCECADVRTKSPTRLHALQKEIEWVQTCTGQYVDTDFFQPGVMQRENKVTYLAKLKQMISSDETKSELEDCTGENNASQHEETPMSRREQNFEFRIKALKLEIGEGKSKIEENMARRASILRKLSRAQDEVEALRIELKRISDVRDEYVDSDVLHGAKQKFQTTELRIALKKRLDGCVSLIESGKTEIMEKDRNNDELSALIEDKEERLRERKGAFLLFKKQKHSSLHLQMKVSGQPENILRDDFNTWVTFIKNIRKIRRFSSIVADLRSRSVVFSTFVRWKDVAKYESRKQILRKRDIGIISKGGALLVDTELASIKVYEDIKATMQGMWKQSFNTQYSEKLNDHPKLVTNRELFSLVRGDYHFDHEEYESSLNWYKSALENLPITRLTLDDNAQIRCVVLSKIGETMMHMQLWNDAILYFDDLLRMANDFNIVVFVTSANLHLGECFISIGMHVQAKKHFLNCLLNVTNYQSSTSNSVKSRAEAGLLACQEESTDYSQNTMIKLHDRSSHISEEINNALQMVDLIQTQIRNASTIKAQTINLEKASSRCIRMKQVSLHLKHRLKRNEEELLSVKNKLKRYKELVSNIQAELHESPRGPNKGARRESSMVHDSAQNFEEDELIQRLHLRLDESRKELKDARVKNEALTVERTNLQDSLKVTTDDLKLEKGALVQRNLQKRSIRMMEFNRLSPTESDQLLIAVTIDRDLFIHNAITGEAVQVFEGDTISDGSKQSRGHSGTITSLYYQGDFVFTGSMDKSLRCWNVNTDQLQYVASGHESTVTSIYVSSNLFSGSADRRIIVWEKATGKQLHRLNGHSRGILTLCEGPSNMLLSGDSDGEIFVWDENVSFVNDQKIMQSDAIPFLTIHQYSCLPRLRLSPRHRVTTIKCGKLEVVCGDHAGFITIFWLESGNIIQRVKAHSSTVTDIAFDATKIVSCGMDCSVKVVDTLSCEILHSIRGQNAPILACIFNSDKLITLCKHGQIVHYLWASSKEKNDVRYHTVAKGENISSICKLYGITIGNVVKWNKDIKNVKVGQKLVVNKATNEKARDAKADFEAPLLANRKTSTKSTVEERSDSDDFNSPAHHITYETTSLASRILRGLALD